jgi:para-aminobenzoate synthetase component I
MENINCQDTIEKMNRWGKEGKPFIFIFDYELKNPLAVPLEKAAENGIYFTFDNLNNIDFKSVEKPQFTFRKFPVSYPVFKKSFDHVVSEIKLGNSFLANLTFPTRIETDLTLTQIFQQSEAPYKLLYNNQFIVFSPELFVTISEGTIASFPMKGTIDASIPDAETMILNDPKETAEHHTIVDLIRNDLSMVATNVKVKKFRYLNKVRTHDQTLLQVSSEVTGKLPENYNEHFGDIILKLLPAGSICGAPKKRTLEIIRQAEIYDRGYYAGVFGIFDGKDLKSAVMIRFIEKIKDEYLFKSGGGITSQSDAEKEYQELIEKVYVPIY